MRNKKSIRIIISVCLIISFSAIVIAGNKNGDSLKTNEVTAAAIIDKDPLPSEYSIKQNYPNPFNPATAIEYSLPLESSVKVCIYNSLGEIIAELVNGTKPAGNYHVNYNAASLSSGIYFCTIRAKSTDGKENYWDIKKMMLLK